MSSEEIYLQTVKDYKKTFGSEAGQKVLWDLMKASGYMYDGFDKDPYQMSYNAGNKAMVVRILSLLDMDEAKVRAMVMEQRKVDNYERYNVEPR